LTYKNGGSGLFYFSSLPLKS